MAIIGKVSTRPDGKRQLDMTCILCGAKENSNFYEWHTDRYHWMTDEAMDDRVLPFCQCYPVVVPGPLAQPVRIIPDGDHR